MRRMLLLLLTLAMLGLPNRMLAAEQCFAADKTPYCLSDAFNDYWNANGGLAVFGYPLSSELNEWNADAAALFPTQWLERNRFEYHAENAGTPYAVLLGLLGKEALAQQDRDWAAAPREAGPQAGCLWFEQTGHNVCNQSGSLGFKAYWESHGLQVAGLDAYARSLQLFGLPLTAPTMETNSSGDTVLTQWFERARFEWHPTNPDAFKVLLGLLGNEVTGGHAALTGEIVYIVQTPDSGNACCDYSLRSIQADGRNPHTITLPERLDARYLHSAAPDGSQVAFIPENPALTKHVMERDGSNVRNGSLGTGALAALQLEWSPDSQHLALAGPLLRGHVTQGYIFILDRTGALEQTISGVNNASIYLPAWSADGQRLSYVQDGSAVWVTGPEGARMIASETAELRFNSPFVWVADDTALLTNAYVYQPGGTSYNQAFRFDVATGAVTQLTDNPGLKTCFILSPDRAWLAFMDGTDTQHAPAKLTVLRVDGSERRTLPGELVSWSPDSQYLLSMEGNAELWALSLDGQRRVRIANSEPGYQKNFAPCQDGFMLETSALWLPN